MVSGPRIRIAGVAGVLAGLGLVVELSLFMASGWQPHIFGDPAAAIRFLQESGGLLRAAGFAGAVNLILTTLFVTGLAAKLHPTAPTAAAATLYLGLIGIGAHALVPLGLWLSVPGFLSLSDQGAATAQAAWAGFAAFITAAGGAGYLFVGLSMLSAGFAGLAMKSLSPTLSWVTLLAGAATVVNVLADSVQLSSIAQMLFFPSILLTILFRIWGGRELLLAESSARAAS